MRGGQRRLAAVIHRYKLAGEIIYKDQTNTEQRRQIPSAGEDIWESLLARIQALIQSDQRSAAERGYLLVNAVREQDPDGVLAALTGWSMQALGAFVELWNQMRHDCV